MPILSQKDNPPSKSFDCSIMEKKGTWWVAKVKPRQEKAFAFDLLEQGVDYYLPYYEKKSQRSDGKFRKSHLVLFPSYVPFISEEPHKYFNKNRVATILPVKFQENFRKQLNFNDIACGSGYQILPIDKNSKFIVGDHIKIISGPFKGLSGRITMIKEKRFLVFNIDALGYALMNILDSQVESSDTTLKQ